MKIRNALSLAIAAMIAPSAALADGKKDYRAEAIAMLKRDFQPRGIASIDRLVEDELQAVCNRSGNNPPKEEVAKLEKDQSAAIKFPEGDLMGDWKEGEKIAQSGRGYTWTDQPGLPVGGNCYNCHQLSPKEMSYGTLGPSLLGFGILRGSSPDIQKYVYAKIYNAKAFNVCSAMPRFGRVGALTDTQIKHLVALLLHPDSPVNK
jgi:sulfur-oxidizing protein SoxX